MLINQYSRRCVNHSLYTSAARQHYCRRRSQPITLSQSSSSLSSSSWSHRSISTDHHHHLPPHTQLSLLESLDRLLPKSFRHFEDDTPDSKRAGGGDDTNKNDDADKNASGGKGGGKDGGKDDKDKFFPGGYGIFLVVAAYFVYDMVFGPLFGEEHIPNEIRSFREFQDHVMHGRVEECEIAGQRVTVKLLNDNVKRTLIISSLDAFERKLEALQDSMEIPWNERIPLHYKPVSLSSGGGRSRFGILDLVLGGAAIYMIYRFSGMQFKRGSKNLTDLFKGRKGGRRTQKGLFSWGESAPTIISKENGVNTTFKDVAGLKEAKVEIMEFVDFLKTPKRFTDLGARLPKGALLVGPPGTGKTLLARATAGEASVPFLSVSGSEFQEMFVGVGASRVRDLFDQAQECAPCIVFIDEIDSMGKKRDTTRGGGANDERESTLNQLLTEMDGFSPTTGVVVMAGTNRPDILDPALLRAGRFDRQIQVDLPDIRGRKEIFEVHLKPIKVKSPPSEVAQRLAALTPGFSGADISSLCNEAALIAARRHKVVVEMVDFEEATDRVIGGLERKSKVMSKPERTVVAYHESGHAICGWFLEFADPLLKVTMVPRANALGYAQYLPSENTILQKRQLIDRMTMALGGRAAEEVFFKEISTGAQDDLRKVTSIAYKWVSEWGLSDKLGHISFNENEYGMKPYAESTGSIIDTEVREIIDECYKRALSFVKERKDIVDKMATTLLKEETLNHERIVEILGDRPHKSEAYDNYVRHAASIDWDTNETIAKADATTATSSTDADGSDTAAEKPSDKADKKDDADGGDAEKAEAKATAANERV